MKCPDCKGKGYKPYPVLIDYATVIVIKEWCEKCRGRGKIERVKLLEMESK